jgi:hypothetical protein
MKKLVLVFAIAALAIGGNAFAQDPNYFNNVGVYFDEAGSNNCDDIAPSTPTDLYLVFTKMTASTILGWELTLEFSGNGFMTSFVPREQSLDVADRVNEHTVGIAAPVPVSNGTFVAADIQVFLFDSAPTYFFTNGNYFHFLDDRVPAYIDQDNNGFELHPVNGTLADPIARINDSANCGVVAEEVDSWGNVKSLFR